MNSSVHISLYMYWSISIGQVKFLQNYLGIVFQTDITCPEQQETWVQSLGQEDPLEEEMATHCSILAWVIPWTERPSRLQFMGSQSQTWQHVNTQHAHTPRAAVHTSWSGFHLPIQRSGWWTEAPSGSGQQISPIATTKATGDFQPMSKLYKLLLLK